MENKYYIPEKSEFYIGFEYEVDIDYPRVNNDGYRFIKMSITEDNWYLNMDVINILDRCRVKYLDKEDIESCGWISCNKEYNDHNSDSDYDYFHNNNILRLRHYKNSHTVVLHNTHGIAVGEYDTFFKGAIKNKSELLKLMKMLGINN